MVSTVPLVVPDGVKELGEVYATDELVGGSACVYRAVFCEGSVELGDRSVVLRWIHAEGALHAGGGSQLLGRTTAEVRLQVDEGCSFERLYAPRILFGAQATPGASMLDVSAAGERQSFSVSDVPLQRVDGDYTIPAHTRVAGDLVVHGNVTVGDDCVLRWQPQGQEARQDRTRDAGERQHHRHGQPVRRARLRRSGRARRRA